MLRYLFFLLLLSSHIFAITPLDCKLSLQIIQPSKSEIKILISHDKNCTVQIEDLNQSISITSNTSTKSIKKQIIALAKTKLGSPYEPAQKGPHSFDCSGFVYYIYKENNISIPRSSINQSKTNKKLTRKELQIGDILAFDTSKKGHVNHTGIYLGKGEFIHASSGKAYSVTISKLDSGFYKDRFQWGIHKTKDK